MIGSHILSSPLKGGVEKNDAVSLLELPGKKSPKSETLPMTLKVGVEKRGRVSLFESAAAFPALAEPVKAPLIQDRKNPDSQKLFREYSFHMILYSFLMILHSFHLIFYDFCMIIFGFM